MIPLTEFYNKDVAVLGLSRTGIAAVKALSFSGANKIYVWDDYKSPNFECQQMHYLEPTKYPWQEISGMIVSPGINLNNVHIQNAIKNHCPLLSDVQLLVNSQKNATCIGITGSNGKSTVTSLLYCILQKAYNNTQYGGNIGIPCLSLQPNCDCYVLEMSSYQLELCSQMSLDLGLLINIASDHTDRYADFRDYLAAKTQIFSNPKVHAIITIDNQYCEQIYHQIKNKKTAVSTKICLQQGISVIEGIVYQNAVPLFALPENHLVPENAAIAVATTLQIEIPQGTIVEGIKSFKGLPYRCQKISTVGNITFINDSKATNSHAMAESLKRYKNIYLIAGGILKDSDQKLLALQNVICVYLFGQSQQELHNILIHKGAKVILCKNLEVAVRTALKDARSHCVSELATILLSPGCSSFDQFENFEHRGNEFNKIINAL